MICISKKDIDLDEVMYTNDFMIKNDVGMISSEGSEHCITEEQFRELVRLLHDELDSSLRGWQGNIAPSTDLTHEEVNSITSAMGFVVDIVEKKFRK